MKKLFTLTSLVFILSAMVTIPFSHLSRAQNSCIQTNFLEAKFHAPMNSTYTFWLRSALKDSKPEKIEVSIDDSSTCKEFKAPSSTNFEWTTGINSALTEKLNAGTHNLKLAVRGGELNTSRMLITGDANCIPEATVENCLDMNLDVRIDGLQANQTIEKYLQITTVLSGAELASPKVDYYFDDAVMPYASDTNPPFCLFSANNSCVQGDISSLGAGQHTLTVTISASNMEETSRSIPFVLITDTSKPIPETTTPPVQPPEIPAVVTPPPAQNNAVIIGNTTDIPTPSVTGTQTVTVAPSRPLSEGDSVIYSVNGTPSATTTIQSNNTNPSANVNLKDASGTTKLSATINRKDGSKETYNATAKVDNSPKAATKKWMVNGGVRAVATVISLILLITGLFLAFKAWRKRSAFSTMHNLYDYQYVQPQKNVAAYSMPPLAVLIFVGGLVFHSLAGASPVQVGVGIDLTRLDIPSDFKLVTTSEERYVTMLGSELVTEGGTNPSTNPVPPTEQPPISSGEFYTKNGYIGRDGKRFVAIGVNGVATARSAYQNPGQWWNDTGMGTMNGRGQQYKSFGFNFVRLNDMRDYSQFQFDDYQNGLFDTIDEYTSLGITCMPTYHQRGPGTNPTPDQLASDSTYQDYWTGIINRYKSNPNVWVNPINEPIGTAWDEWESISNYQYNLMRSKGWTGIVVIDLPQWAQEIGIGTDRLSAFTQGKYNIVIGFHNYDMGNQTAAVTSAQAAGVPILIGEYGETLSGNNRDSQVWVSENAYELGIGAVAWWGAGNREDDYVLRQQVGSTWYDTSIPLNDFGQRLFNLAAHPVAQPNL